GRKRGFEESSLVRGAEVGGDHTPLIARNRAHQEDSGRKQQEQRRIAGEGDRPTPVGREPAAAPERAARRSRYEVATGDRFSGRRQEMAWAQFAARYALAAAPCASLMNTGVPLTGGSAASAALSIVPAVVMAAPSTGLAPPLRK